MSVQSRAPLSTVLVINDLAIVALLGMTTSCQVSNDILDSKGNHDVTAVGPVGRLPVV